MKQILCFGDSNTYGYIPGNKGRYAFDIRWTGILNKLLGLEKIRVVEEGMCGRTTVFDDPLRDFRNGSKYIKAVLDTNGRSELVVIMLGTNDCKTIYGANPAVIGKGIKRLIKQVREFDKDSKILIISPIHLGTLVWEEQYDPEFSKESVEVSKGLAQAYKEVAKEEKTYFFDASKVAEPSMDDMEHLDIKGHKALAEALYEVIKDILDK